MWRAACGPPFLLREATRSLRNTLHGPFVVTVPAGLSSGIPRRSMQELKPKHHSLTGRIDVRLMYLAFRSVKRNRGAAGVDRVSIAMFEANLEQNLLALMHDLKRGSFIPLPARRAYLDKGGGQYRPLGIPAVRDRVAQEVLRRLLSPLFEPRFHDDSYGFRRAAVPRRLLRLPAGTLLPYGGHAEIGRAHV